LICCQAWGCSQNKDRPEQRVNSPFAWGTTIAVAPALNFSGSPAFDPVKVADAMASELASVDGIRVIGVTRVLAVLAEQGIDQIQSPAHALKVCDRLGADIILVFAVTEYDAYKPIVGLAAQLYGRRSKTAGDKIAGSADGRPFPASERADPRPWTEAQRVFNGLHDRVQKSVQEYADQRGEHETPYGWRKYLASQEWYVRFCCFSIIRELMEQAPERAVVESAAHEEHGS